MATTVTENPAGSFQKKGLTADWSLGNAENGDPTIQSQYIKETVQVTGTFGGATVTIQGSNDGTNWVTLNDKNGNALTFTTAGLKTIHEQTKFTRAKTAGGAGTTVAVCIFMRAAS